MSTFSEILNNLKEEKNIKNSENAMIYRKIQSISIF